MSKSKGYYSIILHMFLDLNVNFLPFDVADALDFVSFFAFKCNGTSVLAEIHRLIMSNTKYYNTVFNDCESMYEFLCTVNESFPVKKAVGSCSNPRYNYSGGSNNTKWCKMQYQLLEVCKKYWALFELPRLNRKAMKILNSEMIDVLVHGKSEKGILMFCGVGPMGANQFIHIASLIGLIPTMCYNFSEIRCMSLGPAQLIKSAYPDGSMDSLPQCNSYLHDMHSKFSTVWSDSVSENLFENAMCVCHRRLQRTKQAICKAINVDMDSIPTRVLLDDQYRGDSRTKDTYYIDAARERVQHFFSLRITGQGCSTLRPSLMMKYPKSGGVQKSSVSETIVNLTNWIGNKEDKGLCSWSARGTELSLRSSFVSSKELDEIYKL